LFSFGNHTSPAYIGKMGGAIAGSFFPENSGFF
jgi:hypothetical protein